MEPTKELIDQIYQGKVAAARAMSFEEKLLAGAELFDYACQISRWGIRSQHPDYTDQQVEAELHRRLQIGRKLEGST